MKKLDKAIKNQDGVSLIEVLATIVISSIILGVVYSVFMFGIKTYERTGIEMQLRDEADYIVSSLLYELYETPVHSVSSCQEDEEDHPCLLMKNNKSFKINNEFPSLITEENLNNEQVKTTKLIFTNRSEMRSFVGSNEEKTVLSDEDYNINGSELKIIECINEDTDTSTCEKGLLQIKISIQHNDFLNDDAISVDPIVLESKLGF